jgi:cytochrome c
MGFRANATMVAVLVVASCWPAAAQNLGSLERRGRALLAEKCARCHAIAQTGGSPLREAPPFRTLGQRYPIDALAESLAEGLATGHPEMPEFVFEIEDVDAILAYLRSIQEPAAPRRR